MHYYTNYVKFITSFEITRKMGCCGSRKAHPLAVLRDRYGILQLNNHFLAKIQIEFLRSRRPATEASMRQHSQHILKQRMAEINKKQHIVEQGFEQPLQIARSNPQKAHESELRYNMTLEEIVGLEGIRRKFEQLKSIVGRNIREAEQEMIEDIRMRFQLMESKLKEKVINAELKEVTTEDLEEVQNDFKKSRLEQITIYENQVEQQILKRINFDNYTKRFINVVPQEQLMALAAQKPISHKLANQNGEINPNSQDKCCWCI